MHKDPNKCSPVAAVCFCFFKYVKAGFLTSVTHGAPVSAGRPAYLTHVGRMEAYNVGQRDPATSLGRILTNKDVFWENGRLCGYLGGAVVSKLTAHQEGLSSSPRFFGPSEQVCLSLCGFPAVSSHSPKNMHIRRLQISPGCECVRVLRWTGPVCSCFSQKVLVRISQEI